MGADRMKGIPLRAMTLPGLILAAVALACETEAPTAIGDALRDAMANPDAEASADGADPSFSDIFRDNLANGSRPLVFVDHVEVTGSDEDFYLSLNSLDPNDIARVEIIKGQAAADLAGDLGARGVIHIFSKEYWEESDLDASGRPRD